MNEVLYILELAVKTMFVKQSNIYSFTPESGLTEWNLAHHFANEIALLYKDYNCDIEITKGELESKRPDIIVHRRGTHDNFLVLEIKKDGQEGTIRGECEKVRTYWLAQLNYRYGAVVNFKGNKVGIIVIDGNTNTEKSSTVDALSQRPDLGLSTSSSVLE